MREKRSRPQLRIVIGLILFVVVLAESAAVYFGSDPAMRLGVALLLLAGIVWLSARLGVAESIARSFRGRRRFMRLRHIVRDWLAGVRQLNSIAVDVEGGDRSHGEGTAEMDAIEKRLMDLVRQIRTAAGKIDAHPESGDKPDKGR